MQSIRHLHFERTLAQMHTEANKGRFDRRDVDKHQLAKLTRNARRYLSKRVCWMCELPLDRAGCGSYGGAPPCPWKSRWKRRRLCLQDYKPRTRKAA